MLCDHGECTFRQHLPLCFPVLCPVMAKTQPIRCFGKKAVKKTTHTNVIEARYPSPGGEDSRSALLSATALGRRRAVAVWQRGEMARSTTAAAHPALAQTWQVEAAKDC